jgi:arabinofuranan 3-O-arabinosyltransferase
MTLLRRALAWWRHRSRWTVAVASAVAYGPLLASSPGLVGADTKTYLYLDPGRLMSQAGVLWDADRALGTVTHQNIGFLWPMGPFYWFFEALGAPDWVAQRLWIGTLLFAAGLGVRYLLRTLGFEGRGLLIAMLAYELSPYALNYSARISAVLLPWAGLGWLIGLTVRSARTGGWRHPALFALTVVTVGSVNATSLALAGLGPVLWLVHGAFTDRGIGPRRALATAGRIGVLTVGVSLWWMAGLALQSGYSLSVLRYTETREVVARASTAPEVLRSLGYWFFYGNDKLGPWIEPSVAYTQGGWLIFVGFGLAVLALGSAALVRWRHRSYFVLLAAVGALVAVGFHPPEDPSMLGSLFERYSRTGPLLAMRSLPRAVPLVALALAVLLGVGVNALSKRLRRVGAVAAVLVLAGVVLNNPAMWRIRMVEEHLNRPEEIPEYWLEAAQALDRDDSRGETRAWEIPGSDFASYRWGNTVDPITPGLMDRGYVARELVPFGSAQSASLLGAIDRRLQEGTLDAASLAPVARLMSVGDVVHRADLIFERYRTPRPVETAEFLDRVPGLGAVEAFGDPMPNVAGPEQTLIDEIHLARPADPEHPSPVTRYGVTDPLPIVRTRPVGGATVLMGDAEGIIDAAGAGVVDLDHALVFAADMAADPSLADLVLSEPAHIVVTDSNRRRAQRWGTLRENRGHTETAAEQPMRHDPLDNRLPAFDYEAIAANAGSVDDTRTVSEQRGPVAAQASAHGNPVTYTNDDRPYNALDGSLDTAWVVAAFSEAIGEQLRLTLTEPAVVESMRLVQPQGRSDRHTVENDRHITEVQIRVDSGHPFTVGLDERSLSAQGQTVPLGLEASVIEIEITGTSIGRRVTYAAVAPVGFAEIDLGLGSTLEVIRTPRMMLDRLGDELDDHRLSVVLTRERSDPREPVRTDPELQMVRAVPLPSPLQVEVSGTARLATTTPAELIDDLVGITGTDAGRASSSGHLAGDLPSRASAVLDGDGTTAWTGRFDAQPGQWLELTRPMPYEAGSIEMDVVVDELHSTPAAVQVLVDGTDAGAYELGLSPAAAGTAPDTTATVTIPLARAGATVRLVFVEVIDRLTRDWYSNAMVALPVSVAEVRLGDSPRLGPQAGIDTGCRDDLLTIDGRSVPVRITGTASDALARRELRVEGCIPVTLGTPESLIMATPGSRTGFDIDQLVLSGPQRVLAPAGTGDVDAVRHGDTSYTVRVPSRNTDRWLVLGQSHNRGWHATVDGTDLGPPVVIDGFANGWLLPAGQAATVELRWTPQRLVDWALRFSLVAVAATALIAWRGRGGGGGSRSAVARFEPDRPVLRSPWHRAPAQTASTTAAAVAALAATALAAVSVPDWHALALVAGVVTVLALRHRRLWWLAPMTAAVSLGMAALFVLIQQYRLRYPPDFLWPFRFESVHILGMAAILALACDYVVSVVQSRSLRRRASAGAPKRG